MNINGMSVLIHGQRLSEKRTQALERLFDEDDLPPARGIIVYQDLTSKDDDDYFVIGHLSKHHGSDYWIVSFLSEQGACRIGDFYLNHIIHRDIYEAGTGEKYEI